MTAPVFVVGYLHSGTTLLKWILAKDERYFVGSGETGFLDKRPTFRAMFGDLADEHARRSFLRFAFRVIRIGCDPALNDASHDYSLDELEIDEDTWQEALAGTDSRMPHERIFVELLDILTRRNGKQSWIEKTPTHLFFINDIVRLVPHARIVEIVRDPRAVLASKRRRLQKARRGSAYDPLWDTLAWKSAVRSVSSALDRYPDQVLRVKYETLVAQPEQEVRRICDFTGVRFESRMLETNWLNATAVNTSASGIGSEAVNRWRDELPLGDVAMCQLAAKSEMNSLGYNLEHVPISTGVHLPLIGARSCSEFFVRVRTRGRIGGLPGLRNLASNYWRRTIGLVGR